MYDDIYDQCIAIKVSQQKWTQALVCLLDGLTKEETASRIGVSTVTLERWWNHGVKGRPQLSAAVEDFEMARRLTQAPTHSQGGNGSFYKEAIDKGQAEIEGTSCPKIWLMNLAKSGVLDDIFKTMASERPGLVTEKYPVRAGFYVDSNLYVVRAAGESVALFGVDYDGQRLRAVPSGSGPVFEGTDEAGYAKAIADVLAHPIVARRIRAVLSGATKMRHDSDGWKV